MSEAMFVFSGTGNSWYVARSLSAKLGIGEVTPIARGDWESKPESLAVAGIVFPVYMHRIPKIVKRFLAVVPPAQYLYFVAVNGGDVGHVFTDGRNLLSARGVTLSAGFSVTMPSNYLPFGEAPSGAELEGILRRADDSIDSIAREVSARATGFPREASLFRRLIWPGLTYAMGYKYLSFLDKGFHVDAGCNGCGICERLCPVGNIELVDEIPHWQNQCEQCFGCINWCPQGAIEYQDKTAGLKRYHNPRVKLSELIVRRPAE